MNNDTYFAKPSRNRRVLPNDLVIDSWEKLAPYATQILASEPHAMADYLSLIADINEFESVLDEDMAWRYIKMTCDTQNEAHAADYQLFVQEILPHSYTTLDKMNRKLVDSPFFAQLDETAYHTFKRTLKTGLELFREENVSLFTDDQTQAHAYSSLMGKMSIEHEGKTITPQQAAKLLESTDRALRQTIWTKVAQRRAQDWEAFDDIFDALINIRTKIAYNCGFDSYTDFKYAQLGRFDYTKEDCFAFHQAVEEVITPLYVKMQEDRKQKLGLDSLKPWDLQVDIWGAKPTKPFQNGEDLVQKTITLLGKLKPTYGKMLAFMQELGYLDTESRIGKAPGGYNYPLAESGVPFIFMNAAGTEADVRTMLHESGHAIHSFVTRHIPLNILRKTPSEVAEVASMTMELLSLDYYDVFYPDAKENLRAQKSQITDALMVFPWIVTVDAFQHWVYDHPQHTRAERAQKFQELYVRFHGTTLDWTGWEAQCQNLWKKQLHIFEVPFYYIEYAFAQLGALAIWRNYKLQPHQALTQYENALQLGYTVTIPEIFQTAGIRFDFSKEYVKEVVDFGVEAYNQLQQKEEIS